MIRMIALSVAVFAGVGCDSHDASGIYQLQFTETGGTDRFLAALRVTAGEGGPEAMLFGGAATTVTSNGSNVTVAVRFATEEGDPPRTGTLRVHTGDAGAVTGTYEHCAYEDYCNSYTVAGHKLEPLSGPVVGEPVAHGVRLLSEYGGAGDWRVNRAMTLNVRVAGGLAYLARHKDGLRIVDVSDPQAPVERGHLPVAVAPDEYYNDVKLAAGPDGRRFALMASNRRGVVAIDVSDPDAPFEVTTFPGAGETDGAAARVHTLFIEGPRAYLAYNNDDSLRIYDVSDPARPAALGGWAHPSDGSLHDLYVADGRAYLNYWNLGLVIVDTKQDPQNPTLVGEYADYGAHTSHSNWVTRAGGRLVSVHGDEEYGAHVRVVDVDEASPGFLTAVGSYQTRPEVSVHNIMAVGERAYVTYYQDGLRVLDLHDPAHPVKIAHYHTWAGPEAAPESDYGRSFYEGAVGVDVDPDSGIIYVADTHRGLFVLAWE